MEHSNTDNAVPSPEPDRVNSTWQDINGWRLEGKRNHVKSAAELESTFSQSLVQSLIGSDNSTMVQQRHQSGAGQENKLIFH